MADIPINPVTRRVEFTGNTGTGPFAFTFNVLAQADVAAYKNNTLLALTSDYTVSLNSNGTGSITLTSALIATDELVIIGDLALSRTTDFVTAGDLLASSLNEQFDSNVVMSQQLDERFDRTIRSQPGDINKNLYLPLVSSRASQLLSFDSSGNITTTSLSNVPDIGTVNLTVSGVASFADGSASAPSITNIGDTNTGMYFGAADQINFSIGGSEVISVASTGTTISGLSISSGDILLTDNSATALEIKEGSNNYLTFITTNGSEKLSFGSTANPTFEVNGSFRQPLIAATTSFFSQTYSGATLSATNGSVNIESYSASKAGIVLNGSGDQITFTSPTLGFVGLVQVVGAITTNTSLNIASSTTVDGILDEDNMASNSATKLATQQSIKAYVDAQVGTVDTLAEVLGNGNTTGGTNIVVSANDVISLDDGTNALPSLTTTGDLNTGIYFPAADEVGITTGGTQRVKVDSTGVNVTGTVTATGTSVFASLDISGDIDVDGTTNLDVVDIDGAVDMASTLNVSGITDFGSYQGSSVNSPVNVKSDSNHFAISLEENSGTETWQLGVDVDGDLNFHNSGNATPSVIFDDSGNVGIGCTPNLIQSGFDTLQIGGNLTLNVDSTGVGAGVYMGNNVYRDSADSRWEYINTDEASQYLQANGEHIWRYAGSGTANTAITWSEAMRITSTGSVGIGTSSPSANLEITQSGNNVGLLVAGGGYNYTAKFESSDAEANIIIEDSNSTDNGNMIGVATNDMYFITDGTERMRIDSSGNVIVKAGKELRVNRPDNATYGAISHGVSGTGIVYNDLNGDGHHWQFAGSDKMSIDSSGNLIIASTGGTLQTATAGTSNFRAGVNAGNSIASGGNYNTVVGDEAGTAITTGDNNTLIGYVAGDAISTSSGNTAVGSFAMTSMTDGADNVAVGTSALDIDTKGSKSVAVGRNALGGQNFATATDTYNVAVGYDAGKAVTTGTQNTLVGGLVADALTEGGNNVAFGQGALGTDTKGSHSTAIGSFALGTQNFTTATDTFNVAVGHQAGNLLQTGTYNTFLGPQAGFNITTGSNNTIIGQFDGNNYGLDIRPSSNNLVLSDGDGNPRAYFTSDGCQINGGVTGGYDSSPYVSLEGFFVALNDGSRVAANFGATNTASRTVIQFCNPNGVVGTIVTDGSSTAYNTSSDHRLKENVVELTGATTRLKQLEPKRFNFISDADTTVDGFLAHEVQSVVPEAITGTHNEVDADGNPVYQGIDQSKLVPLLVATIQELEARITALENA